VRSELSILDVSVGRPLDGLFEAVRRRSVGERFFVRVVDVDHARPAHAIRQAARIIERTADPDERLAAFDALAREQVRLPTLGRRVIQTIREIFMLSDGVAVTSSHDHFRIELTFGCTVEPHYVEASPDSPVPEFVRAEDPDAIVVWAPTTAAADLTLIAFALEELHHPVYVVCAGGKKPALRAQYVGYEDAAAALSRACVVIDPSPHRANALELAKRGLPLIVNLTSGAVEVLDGVGIFVPWDRADVLRAVQSGLALPAPSLRRAGATPLDQLVREPEIVDGPLVSIVIRTYNRPRFLERALQSAERQTYRNLEIVVVSDGGEDVSGIVARFGRAGLIVHETRRGAVPAANTGLHASRGEFVGLLDDDDVLFPDHVSSLVAALRRSGAGVAHADTVSAFYDMTADHDVPYGYSIFLNKIGEPTDLYLSDGIGPMSALFRREAALDLGGYDETLPHAEDWDLWIRLAQRYDFVRVRRVTAQYSIRNDETNMMIYNSAGFKRAMLQLTEKFPLDDRPLLAEARANLTRLFLSKAGPAIFPPPALERR